VLDCDNCVARHIIRQRPHYDVVENNCQNFVKFLVEAISPGSFCPKTISDVLEEWLERVPRRLRIPGAYPRDSLTGTSTSGTRTYNTVSENTRRSFCTASENEWLSALESIPSTVSILIHDVDVESLSASFHISQLTEAESGPSPHPAPTTRSPLIPGAPQIPYTTPAQERNSYLSYRLYNKPELLNKQEIEATKKKRHSAPLLKTQLSLPLLNSQSVDIRRTISDTAAGNLLQQIHPINSCRRLSIG
jgi:hypothetical protein